MKPTFSIVTPAFNREDTIERCMKSVFFQTYDSKLYEHILIDDGSSDNTSSVVRKVADEYGGIRNEIGLLTNPERRERLLSRNAGMEEAKNDWICWLDSDDAYTQRYLEVLADAIEGTPEARCFNFGAIVHHKDHGMSVRPTFRPKMIEQREQGKGLHEEFRSGGIGTGSFVFHRSVLEEVGGLPPERTPYALRDFAAEQFSEEWNKNKKIFSRYIEDGTSLGNPWGDDFYMFYKITREFYSVPLNANLYYHNVR